MTPISVTLIVLSLDNRHEAKLTLTRDVEPTVVWKLKLEVLDRVNDKFELRAAVDTVLEAKDHADAEEIAQKGLCPKQVDRARVVAEQIRKRPESASSPETQARVISILHA